MLYVTINTTFPCIINSLALATKTTDFPEPAEPLILLNATGFLPSIRGLYVK